ncbi:hypothetical protein J4422_00310 [Candidatus Pacearchaeota archaeon]|nr:hypothetical protein [Candidatus Pacearchaeota archaeon]
MGWFRKSKTHGSKKLEERLKNLGIKLDKPSADNYEYREIKGSGTSAQEAEDRLVKYVQEFRATNICDISSPSKIKSPFATTYTLSALVYRPAPPKAT